MKKVLYMGIVSTLLFSCQKEQPQTVSQEPVTQQQVQQQPTEKPIEQEETAKAPQQGPVVEAKKPEEKKTEEKPSLDGKSIFVSKGCGSCHQESADTVGPSLKKISSVYGGDKQKLISFFKGEGKSIVDPAKEAIMKPQIEVIKKLSSDEQEALANFILKH